MPSDNPAPQPIVRGAGLRWGELLVGLGALALAIVVFWQTFAIPLSPIYAKVENSHGLLRDAFQQSVVALAQVFDPDLKGDKVFPQFQTKLEQSLAILLHLAERYGRERGLWPSDEAGRAEALSWTVWGTAELRPYMMQYVYHGLDTPISYKPNERSRAAAEYNGSEFRRVLDALEQRLANREYLLGAFSLCDISAASALLFGQKLGVTAEGRTNVAAWLARAGARPARIRSRGE